jgi:hypothetical protein
VPAFFAYLESLTVAEAGVDDSIQVLPCLRGADPVGDPGGFGSVLGIFRVDAVFSEELKGFFGEALLADSWSGIIEDGWLAG